MAARRFTVITGGADGNTSERAATNSVASRLVESSQIGSSQIGSSQIGSSQIESSQIESSQVDSWHIESWHIESWHIDLCRPGQVVPEAEAAWRALLTRTGASDPFADPDYLQAAARHGAGGREVVFALAWGRTGARRVLCGAIPLTMPNPVWGHRRIGLWQPHGYAVAPAVAASHGDAVHAALHEHLGTVRRGAALDLAPPAQAGGRPTLRSVPEAARVPAHNLLDIGGAGASVRERVVEPDRIRDAVEEFLILDAAHATAPIIGDPSEATLVRVVTRLFARRRQAAVDLTRRDGRVVAAALHLGTGPNAVVWRRASEGMAGSARLDRSA